MVIGDRGKWHGSEAFHRTLEDCWSSDSGFKVRSSGVRIQSLVFTVGDSGFEVGVWGPPTQRFEVGVWARIQDFEAWGLG